VESEGAAELQSATVIHGCDAATRARAALNRVATGFNDASAPLKFVCRSGHTTHAAFVVAAATLVIASVSDAVVGFAVRSFAPADTTIVVPCVVEVLANGTVEAKVAAGSVSDVVVTPCGERKDEIADVSAGSN
jgi:hypothetical protein